MNKRAITTIAILLVLVSLVLTACRQASPEAINLNGFNVILSKPNVEFPDSITFDIDVAAKADISRITFQYQVQKLSVFPVTSVAFPPFTSTSRVKTSWKWDMTQTGGLPPGTDLTYWWAIEDAEGNTAQTPVSTLSFDDQRHSWQSSSENEITLLWYQGNDSFVQQLMTAAKGALDRLAEDTGARPEDKVSIYIYASTQDLQDAMLYPNEWTGGVAYSEYHTIAIGISPDNLDWGKGAMAHELAHLVVHQVTFSGYGIELPTWLDEGLAMYAEGSLVSDMASVLKSAITQNKLISAKSLCSPFPAEADAAILAYAESYSLVKYLLEQHGGQAKMLELLNAFKQGSGYNEALDRVYGLDIDKLNDLWSTYIRLHPVVT